MTEHKIRKVLVLDDDPAYQGVFEKLFDSLNLSEKVVIDVCNRIDQAVSQLDHAENTHQPYDVVIVDHFLPDGTGYDLWKSRCNKSTGTIFIVVSGSGENDYLSNVSKNKDSISYVSKEQSFAGIRQIICKKIVENWSDKCA